MNKTKGVVSTDISQKLNSVKKQWSLRVNMSIIILIYSDLLKRP